MAQQSPREMADDWAQMTADRRFIDVRGPFYGIGRGLRTDDRFRQYIVRLMSLIPFHDGALSFYCYQQGFEGADVCSVAGRMQAPDTQATNILAGVPHTKPDYLYGYYPLDTQGFQVWQDLIQDLEERVCEG